MCMGTVVFCDIFHSLAIVSSTIRQFTKANDLQTELNAKRTEVEALKQDILRKAERIKELEQGYGYVQCSLK